MRKQKNIYIVKSGYVIGDANQLVRFISFDYTQALRIARKLVRQVNNAMNQKDKKHYGLLNKNSGNDESTAGLGEKIIDNWCNKIENVTIVMYRQDKEYSPEWLTIR